jgi:hypothetical protein
MTEQSIFSRLEDFISLARKGEEVDLTVTLDKQICTFFQLIMFFSFRGKLIK